MRRTVMAVAVVLLTAACSSTSHTPPPQPPSRAATSPSATVAPSTPTAPTLTLGQTAKTVGSLHPFETSAQPGAPLNVTPTTVVYSAKGGPVTTPQNGLFAIVTVKAAAPANTAMEAAPVEGGGWTWIAPDGQAVSSMDGTANQVVLDGLHGDLAPGGGYVWESTVFDIAPSQKGGTLRYVDGHGDTYQWKVPAANTGPQLAQVEKALTQ